MVHAWGCRAAGRCTALLHATTMHLHLLHLLHLHLLHLHLLLLLHLPLLHCSLLLLLPSIQVHERGWHVGDRLPRRLLHRVTHPLHKELWCAIRRVASSEYRLGLVLPLHLHLLLHLHLALLLHLHLLLLLHLHFALPHHHHLLLLLLLLLLLHELALAQLLLS
jgi:hypothetical protein